MNRLCFILVVGIASSCGNKYSGVEDHEAGICISFDDRYIGEWVAMCDSLEKYSPHFTFFITHFDSLSDEEISLLKKLQTRGHEIGSHGFRHVMAEHYIKENSLQSYLDEEIVPSIGHMRIQGFIPTSFAYPYGSKYWGTESALRRHFRVLRNVTILSNKKIEHLDEIYYPFDGSTTSYALGIDRNNFLTREMIIAACQRAARNKEVLMLYGHRPGTGGNYTFDFEFLETIIQVAKEYNLKLYTFSETRL